MHGTPASRRSPDSQTVSPVSASFGGGEEPRRRPRVQSVSLGVAPFQPRYGEAHHPATEVLWGALQPGMGHERRFLKRLVTGARNGLAMAAQGHEDGSRARWVLALGPITTSCRSESRMTLVPNC